MSHRAHYEPLSHDALVAIVVELLDERDRLVADVRASDNRAAVAEALRALGEAWRGDWSDFDGRSLRASLDGIASWLASDADAVTYDELCRIENMCPVNRCWPEHCPDGFGSWCSHLEATALAPPAPISENAKRGNE